MTTLRLRPDFEAALRQIQGVRAASVVTTGTGVPSEIHILAATGKAPKQVVRDVQSLAMARFDLDIDHRIVSVVQLDESDLEPAKAPVAPATDEVAPNHDHDVDVEASIDAAFAEFEAMVESASEIDTEVIEIDLRDPAPIALSVVPDSAPRHASTGGRTAAARAAAPARVIVVPDAIAAEAAVEDDPGPRPSISTIMLRTSGEEAEATVSLAADGHLFEGQVVGPAGTSHRPRLIAQATLAALADLLGQATEIESVTLVGTGHRTVALTVLTVQTPRIGEQVVTGSAMVRGDEADAVARSVLDALNRRLSG